MFGNDGIEALASAHDIFPESPDVSDIESEPDMAAPLVLPAMDASIPFDQLEEC